jgi:hypothetical protein
MNRILSAIFIATLGFSLILIADNTASASTLVAKAQVGYIKRKSRKVGHRIKYKSKYAARKTTKGTRWTAHKTKRGTKTGYYKTKRVTKKTYSKTKDKVSN